MSKLQQIVTHFVLALGTLLLISWQPVVANACAGCIGLDELNFDKTIARFPYAIVKFDIAFPYGAKHEAYAQFAKTAHRVTDELLVATVGIKDYGDNENKALGERFQLTEKNFPSIFLFKGAADVYVPLPTHMDLTVENLQQFVSAQTPLYIGLQGCLKVFNALSKGYANLADAKQLELLAEGERLAQQLSKTFEQAYAKNYLTFMRKVNEKGYAFVGEESKRLHRLRTGGKVSEAKKQELQEKLNVLDTFRVVRLTKEEQEL